MPTAWAKNNKGNSAKGAKLTIAKRTVKTAYFAKLFKGAAAGGNSGGTSSSPYIVPAGSGWNRAEDKTGLSKAELMKLNNLTSDALSPNQELITSNTSQSSSSTGAVTHTVKKDETLWGISRAHSVSVDEIKSWNNLSGNDISAGQKLKVSTNKSNSSFEMVSSASIGEDLYVVVETDNLSDQYVEVVVRQGKAEVIVSEHAAITVTVDDKEVSTIKMKIGELSDQADYESIIGINNLAAGKIKLGPKSKETKDQWQDKIEKKDLGLTHLYLSIDAHEVNDLKKSVIDYQGYAGTDDDSNVDSHFLNEKNTWLEFRLEDHVCIYCAQEFTVDQIVNSTELPGVKTYGKADILAGIKKVLPYLNKYREDFGLDTCLKKAHFIAQANHESGRFKAFEEHEGWNSWNDKKNKPKNFPGVFSNTAVVFDSVMATSLNDYLTKIFTIKDKDNKVLSKTNAQIKKILLDEKVKVVDKKLYAKYDRGSKLQQTVKEKVKDKTGKTVEVVKYKIYLKDHKAFGVPLLSRMYAPYPGDRRGLGNGNELSQDGWKYKGRGLKQLTGVAHYRNFSQYRNRADITFPGDNSGEIDFSVNTDSSSPQDVKKGNYIKIAEPKYAVQSALFFWNEGTQYNGKYAVDLAKDDDVDAISKAVNRKDTGSFQARKDFYLRARKSDVFGIVRHHKELYEHGSAAQKKAAKAYFKKWGNSDAEAKKILEEIEKK